MKKKYRFRHQEIYRDVKIDIKADSTGELLDKLQQKRLQIDKQTISPKTKLLDFGQMFLKTYKQASVSLSWYNDLETILKNKIVDGIGNRQMDKIRPMDIQLFLNSLTDLSDSYIKKIFDFTKQLFHQAYKNGITPSDYSEDLQRPKGRSGAEGRSLTDAEAASMLKVIKGTPDELFIRIMYQCGLRPGEVCALIWSDIDFESLSLSVNKAQKKDGSIGAPKSAAGIRTVPIPDDLAGLLLSSKGSPFDLVCPKQKGGHHTKDSLRKLWERTKYRMNVDLGAKVSNGKIVGIHPVQEPLRFYDLRHTYCTNLEKVGVPINIASRIMGHSDISVTAKIYTHASDEAMDIARNMINRSSENVDEKSTALVR